MEIMKKTYIYFAMKTQQLSRIEFYVNRSYLSNQNPLYNHHTIMLYNNMHLRFRDNRQILLQHIDTSYLYNAYNQLYDCTAL